MSGIGGGGMIITAIIDAWRLWRLRMIKMLTLCVCSILLTACVSKMPIGPETAKEKMAGKTLGLFLLSTSNEHTDFILKPGSIYIKGPKDSSQFKFPEPIRSAPAVNEYTVVGSIEGPPGDYVAQELYGNTDFGMALILPVIGRFDQKIGKRFQLIDQKIVYLGHVKARLVEKTSDDEERAGQITPIIDQLKTGMSDGTFKFTVEDNYEEDLNLLRSKYPAIGGFKIEKQLMQ